MTEDVMKPFVIGICGPSGSGKSTIAGKLAGMLGCEVLSSDRFFKSELPTMISPADGKEYPDWNSPDSVDYAALVRTVEEKKKEPGFLIVEGCIILTCPELCELLDYVVYTDASTETCLFRRIARNVKLMGFSVEEIGEYYLKCARYREKEYCLPQKGKADFVVGNEYGFDADLKKCAEDIKAKA
ncbi:MAG: AAA family ATPase [Clostridia bacterium]|nr:AAA family ATPase [Clostridia bacterium]